ncbi:hypothetical protein NSPZN2_11440 [Nitrospira defluvii]|uniref:Uncharacterized protein n=1 Tax=Nitrospira defluvii TaxID=330214 RepID=A0ABM8QU82_9BACT|nr:hypothetical protein NSPZN2_11440 [Nitrospira defluvii]
MRHVPNPRNHVGDGLGLEGNANAHLELVRHHAFPHGIAEETLLRKDRLKVQRPITLSHIAPAKAGADVGNQGLFADTYLTAQRGRLAKQVRPLTGCCWCLRAIAQRLGP